MSLDAFGDLNWLAVVVATLAYFFLGAAWYAGPVFGKAWTRASGIRMPDGERPSASFYLVPLATCAVATIATALLARSTGSETFGEGVVLGLVVGVGYAVTLTALGGLFDQKPEPRTWFLISAGYHLVGLLIASVIVTVWE